LAQQSAAFSSSRTLSALLFCFPLFFSAKLAGLYQNPHFTIIKTALDFG